MKKFFSVIVLSLMFLLIYSSNVFASEISFSAVGFVDKEKEEFIDITYSNTENKYYLILPSTADLGQLKISFDFGDDVFVGETKLESNKVTDVFAEEGDYILTSGSDTYTLCVQKTDFPAVIINTESGNMDYVHKNKENKEKGTIVIASTENVEYNGVLTHIKGRGNTTWGATKKPYNIKLDKKTNIFGMGKSKNWCLLANYYDKTLIRNQVLYEFAQYLGINNTSDVHPVNLFINGEYYGVYTITEKVEIGENRVDINDLAGATEDANPDVDIESLTTGGSNENVFGSYKYVNIPNNPDNITGGYLLELDYKNRYNSEISGFITSRGQCVVIKEPEYASKEQVEYIRKWYQAFEDAVYSKTGYNAEGKHYSEYCDINSLVSAFLVNDISSNMDASGSSFFLYKDCGEKMYAGPIWDLDFALCNETASKYNHNVCNPEANIVSTGYIPNNGNFSGLFSALFHHYDFKQEVNTVFDSKCMVYKQTLIENIEKYSKAIKNDMLLNSVVTDTFGVANRESIEIVFDNEIFNIENFVIKRFNYLDRYYSSKLTVDEEKDEPVPEESIHTITDGVAVHKWDEGKITIPATCTGGLRTYSCTVKFCTATKNEKLTATDHSFKGTVKSNNDGTHSFKCENCNIYGEKVKCTPVLKNYKPATVNNDGYTGDNVCSVCGYITEKGTVISKLKYGDIDKDGKITAADARFALRAAVGLEKYEKGSIEFDAADVDKDGKITAADARLILRASVNLENLNK